MPSIDFWRRELTAAENYLNIAINEHDDAKIIDANILLADLHRMAPIPCRCCPLSGECTWAFTSSNIGGIERARCMKICQNGAMN